MDERDVRPERSPGRQPAKARRVAMAPIEIERLRLRDRSAGGGDPRGPEVLAPQHRRIVEIEDPGSAIQLEPAECERQAAAAQDGSRQALTAERGELLDDAGLRTVGEVQAAVGVGIVVPALALEDARKRQRPVPRLLSHAPTPCEAAVERHANESARSARIARINSSARPARTRSIGRRSPSRGLTPDSHESAASRSYTRSSADQTRSSRSTRSAFSGSMPAPRSHRVTCERLTPSMSASWAADRKSARSASTFPVVPTGMTSG